jgi:hypothetical protein
VLKYRTVIDATLLRVRIALRSHLRQRLPATCRGLVGLVLALLQVGSLALEFALCAHISRM